MAPRKPACFPEEEADSPSAQPPASQTRCQMQTFTHTHTHTHTHAPPGLALGQSLLPSGSQVWSLLNLLKASLLFSRNATAQRPAAVHNLIAQSPLTLSSRHWPFLSCQGLSLNLVLQDRKEFCSPLPAPGGLAAQLSSSARARFSCEQERGPSPSSLCPENQSNGWRSGLAPVLHLLWTSLAWGGAFLWPPYWV